MNASKAMNSPRNQVNMHMNLDKKSPRTNLSMFHLKTSPRINHQQSTAITQISNSTTSPLSHMNQTTSNNNRNNAQSSPESQNRLNHSQILMNDQIYQEKESTRHQGATEERKKRSLFVSPLEKKKDANLEDFDVENEEEEEEVATVSASNDNISKIELGSAERLMKQERFQKQRSSQKRNQNNVLQPKSTLDLAFQDEISINDSDNMRSDIIFMKSRQSAAGIGSSNKLFGDQLYSSSSYQQQYVIVTPKQQTGLMKDIQAQHQKTLASKGLCTNHYHKTSLQSKNPTIGQSILQAKLYTNSAIGAQKQYTQGDNNNNNGSIPNSSRSIANQSNMFGGLSNSLSQSKILTDRPQQQLVISTPSSSLNEISPSTPARKSLQNSAAQIRPGSGTNPFSYSGSKNNTSNSKNYNNNSSAKKKSTLTSHQEAVQSILIQRGVLVPGSGSDQKYMKSYHAQILQAASSSPNKKLVTQQQQHHNTSYHQVPQMSSSGNNSNLKATLNSKAYESNSQTPQQSYTNLQSGQKPLQSSASHIGSSSTKDSNQMITVRRLGEAPQQSSQNSANNKKAVSSTSINQVTHLQTFDNPSAPVIKFEGGQSSPSKNDHQPVITPSDSSQNDTKSWVMRPFPFSQCFNSKIEEYVSQKIVNKGTNTSQYIESIISNRQQTKTHQGLFNKKISPSKGRLATQTYEVVDLNTSSDQDRQRMLMGEEEEEQVELLEGQEEGKFKSFQEVVGRKEEGYQEEPRDQCDGNGSSPPYGQVLKDQINEKKKPSATKYGPTRSSNDTGQLYMHHQKTGSTSTYQRSLDYAGPGSLMDGIRNHQKQYLSIKQQQAKERVSNLEPAKSHVGHHKDLQPTVVTGHSRSIIVTEDQTEPQQLPLQHNQSMQQSQSSYQRKNSQKSLLNALILPSQRVLGSSKIYNQGSSSTNQMAKQLQSRTQQQNLGLQQDHRLFGTAQSEMSDNRGLVGTNNNNQIGNTTSTNDSSLSHQQQHNNGGRSSQISIRAVGSYKPLAINQSQSTQHLTRDNAAKIQFKHRETKETEPITNNDDRPSSRDRCETANDASGLGLVEYSEANEEDSIGSSMVGEKLQQSENRQLKKKDKRQTGTPSKKSMKNSLIVQQQSMTGITTHGVPSLMQTMKNAKQSINDSVKRNPIDTSSSKLGKTKKRRKSQAPTATQLASQNLKKAIGFSSNNNFSLQQQQQQSNNPQSQFNLAKHHSSFIMEQSQNHNESTSRQHTLDDEMVLIGSGDSPDHHQNLKLKSLKQSQNEFKDPIFSSGTNLGVSGQSRRNNGMALNSSTNQSTAYKRCVSNNNRAGGLTGVIGSNPMSQHQQASNLIHFNKQNQNPLKSSIQGGSGPNNGHQTLNQITNQVQQNVISKKPISGQDQIPQPTKKVVKNWLLTEQEKATYGDRVPKGYEKLDLLGKGGCALVWLGKNKQTGQTVALKQFPKGNGKGIDSTAQAEVTFGRMIFPRMHGNISYGLDPQMYPGIKFIAKLLDEIDDSKDFWLVYEVGSSSLNKHLFEVKGEFYKGERIYLVNHSAPFYQQLKQDKTLFSQLIKMTAQAFRVLAELKIVHADIKPDNLLIQYDQEKKRITDMKLIDFGSAFSFESPSNIQASTPEYLAPEVLEYLNNRAQNTQSNGTNSENLCRIQLPWSYDVWSFGALLLEIMTGFPLWLSMKGRMQTPQGKSILGTGLFGVQGREGKKILARQIQLLRSGDHAFYSTLKKYDCFNIDRDPHFMDLLLGMLEFNPTKRLSPEEILTHPFITLNEEQ